VCKKGQLTNVGANPDAFQRARHIAQAKPTWNKKSSIQHIIEKQSFSKAY